MTAKKIVFGLAILSLSTGLFLTGCKKKEETPAETPTTPAAPAENGQSSTDSKDAQSENDAAVDDINNVIGGSRLAGRGTTVSICGLSVDSVNIASGVITFSYNGTTCNNRTRTGVIKLTLVNPSIKWKNVGAQIKVEYINYKITRASDGKFLLFNGTQYLTNISGGNWGDLLFWKTKTSLVTTVTGTNLAVTFSDNKTATYNINRKFTYTYPKDVSTGLYVLTAQVEGIGSTTTTSGALSNLENYGTTRDGDAFTSQVTTPLIWNLTCGPWAPIQGALNMKVSSKAFDVKVTYGVDVNGTPVTVGSNGCPYGWKLEWTVGSVADKKIFGYL